MRARECARGPDGVGDTRHWKSGRGCCVGSELLSKGAGLEAFIVGMEEWNRGCHRLYTHLSHFLLIKQLSRIELLPSPGTFFSGGWGGARQRCSVWGDPDIETPWL